MNDAEYDRIVSEVFLRPQAPDALGWLCDNVAGRVSGTEDGSRAEEWAERLLRSWGLDHVWYEELPVPVWTRGDLSAVVVEPGRWSLTGLAHGNSPTAADVTAEVVYVGHGERPDYDALRGYVAGRLALCDEGGTEGERVLHRSEKLRLAAEFGAVGLLIESSAPGHIPRTGVCHQTLAPIPSIGISLEDGARLRRLIASGIAPVIEASMRNSFTQSVARNVVAELTGTSRPNEVVLAGAHLDSWDVAEGATDNGLGCAIVLEMARSLATLTARPSRTARFALWAAEEVGLMGSRQYCHRHADDLSDHVAVMNFDMTGAPVGFWTPGHRRPATVLAELAPRLRPLGFSKPLEHSARLHSDHQPFMLEGVPIVCLQSELRTEGRTFYHSTGDTYEKVSTRDLCLAAATGALTMWELANVAERPYKRLSPEEVRRMIDDARLLEALRAEGYDGPPMHVDVG